MAHAAPPQPAGPAGNVTDKYGATNPVARRLMARFLATLDELLAHAAPESVLDVGCGEGVVTERFARRLAAGRVVGVDPSGKELAGEWERRRRPNLDFRVAAAGSLPYADREFDLVAGIEVLEHVADPRAAMREMARVAGTHLLLSVPREPLWRALNVARGAYLRALGDTPGHVNHFSRRGFARLVSRHGRLEELRSPLPWTVALVALDG